MSPTFSHSRLAALDDCPRRYRLRYVEKVQEAFQTVEAFMGTLVHEALQWLYLRREESAAEDEAALVERYRSSWAARHGPSVRVVQEGALAETSLREGEDMLRRHHRSAFREDRLRTLAIEPKVTLRLRPEGEDEAAYVGYIDRLAQDAQGTMHVIDYKTSRRMPESIEHAGLQVRGYGLGVLETHGGAEVELRYEYLRHERRLQETMSLSLGPAVATELARRVGRALATERAGDFPARPSELCRWCGYRESCDASPFHRAAPGAGCPLCGSAVKLRTGSRGALVACVRYPDCLHAREALPEDEPAGRG